MKHHTLTDIKSYNLGRVVIRVLAVTLLVAGLLAAPRAGLAQLIVSGPATPTAQALSVWYAHLPACFQAKDRITLYLLNDQDMDDYLKSIGLKDGTSYASVDGGGEIDGLFVDKQRRISLRISPTGAMDMETLTHEYGHYVWYYLFGKNDRQEYRGIYKISSRAHCLVTDYAGTNLEEGFAEAFGYYFTDAATLQQKDLASYQFIAAWAAAATPNISAAEASLVVKGTNALPSAQAAFGGIMAPSPVGAGQATGW